MIWVHLFWKENCRETTGDCANTKSFSSVFFASWQRSHSKKKKKKIVVVVALLFLFCFYVALLTSTLFVFFTQRFKGGMQTCKLAWETLFFHVQISSFLGHFTWLSYQYLCNAGTFLLEGVPLVEFMYLAFACMPCESYRRWLRSLLLYLCYVCCALINSLGSCLLLWIQDLWCANTRVCSVPDEMQKQVTSWCHRHLCHTTQPGSWHHRHRLPHKMTVLTVIFSSLSDVSFLTK